MRRRVLGIGVALVLLALVILLIALRSDRDTPRPEVAVAPSTPVKHAPPVPTLAPDAATPTDDTLALPQPTITAASNEVATGGTATITGRVVTADGTPLTAYGLLVTKRTEPHYADDPIVVHDAKGRFTFKSVKAGTWNIVIGAPHVARTIVANVAIADGKLTDVGTITVERGARIKGRVLDGTSHPVAGAKVALATSGFAITSITTEDGRPVQNDALRDDVAGKHSTTTNAAGEFMLDGVAPGTRPMWIEATSGKLSARHDVPSADATVDFILVP